MKLLGHLCLCLQQPGESAGRRKIGSGGEGEACRGEGLPASSQAPLRGSRDNGMGEPPPSWLDHVPVFHGFNCEETDPLCLSL